MFDNYKKTLTKQEKKQFAAIQKQLVPLSDGFFANNPLSFSLKKTKQKPIL